MDTTKKDSSAAGPVNQSGSADEKLALPSQIAKASTSKSKGSLRFGSSEKCVSCGKTVYVREKIVADGKVTPSIPSDLIPVDLP